MRYCGKSYHDERGEVQDCEESTPCRSCLIAELQAVRGELARVRRNHLRRMAQATLLREMWCKRKIVSHWDVFHRGGARFAGLQTAIRAALANNAKDAT